MARYMPTGRMVIVFAPTVAAATFVPTTAEITAGVRLQTLALRDGLDTPASGNTIDASDISSLFNSTAPGTYGGDALELVCHRDSKPADDIAWTTLARGTIGFLIVARNGFNQLTTGLGNNATAQAAVIADKVECYPVTVISRAMAKTGDETARFSATMAITSPPNDYAAITA